MRLTVKDVMTVDPITADPNLPFKEVVNRIIDHDIGALPVVNDQGAVVGIITESDLTTKPAYGNDQKRGPKSVLASLLKGTRRSHPEHKASGLTAQEIMSKKVVTATADEELKVVARRLVHHRIGRLPVVDDGRLIGIVSLRDLLVQFHRPDEEIAADLNKVLNDPVAFEHGHHVTFTVNEGVVSLTGSVSYPYELGTLTALIRDIPGVVDINNEITARQPDPRPEPPISQDPFLRPI